MVDSQIKGTGNSRYLKTVANASSLYPTYNDFITAMMAGTFPVDMNGKNANGFTVVGTDINKASLLSDATAAKFNLSSTGTPNDALAKVVPLVKNNSLFVRRCAKFTQSGTFTSPFTGTAKVICVGGGGGGAYGVRYGSLNDFCGGGGGGSGYITIKDVSLTQDTDYSVVIGAGGTGGIYGSSVNNYTPATVGGTTTFSFGSTILVSADGGNPPEDSSTRNGGSGNAGGGGGGARYTSDKSYVSGGNGGRAGTYGGGGGGGGAMSSKYHAAGGAGGRAGTYGGGGGGGGAMDSSTPLSLTPGPAGFSAPLDYGGSGGESGSNGNNGDLFVDPFVDLYPLVPALSDTDGGYGNTSNLSGGGGGGFGSRGGNGYGGGGGGGGYGGSNGGSSTAAPGGGGGGGGCLGGTGGNGAAGGGGAGGFLSDVTAGDGYSSTYDGIKGGSGGVGYGAGGGGAGLYVLSKQSGGSGAPGVCIILWDVEVTV